MPAIQALSALFCPKTNDKPNTYSEIKIIIGSSYDPQFNCMFFKYRSLETGKESSMGKFAFPRNTEIGDHVTFTYSETGGAIGSHISKKAKKPACEPLR